MCVLKKIPKVFSFFVSLIYTFLFISQPVFAQQVGNLLWEENFNTFDTSLWNTAEGDGCGLGICGWGNQELQYYQANNALIEAVPGESGNSALVLEARRESVGGKTFTSARVNSQSKVSVHYGMIETRIRVPDLNLGLWPAFWLLGTSTESWPANGEIDVMEMGHKRSEIDAFHAGTPLNNYVGSNVIFYSQEACVEGNPTCAASSAWQADNAYAATTPLNDRFAIYRLYWTSTQIRFSIVDEGVEHFIYDQAISITEEASEFTQPFYLLMNLAVGGNFTDAASDAQVTVPMPAKMYIDYIRVYELDGQGSVQLGAPALGGEFGVFTETTVTDNALQAGTSSDVYVWSQDSLSAGTEQAYEGTEVLSWNYNLPGNWFGAGVQSRQPLNLQAFETGELRFKIKIPADVNFKIGITDTFSNENYVTFPANQTVYNLTRNGDWGEVKIPVADLRGDLIALQSISYPFAILSDDTALPSNTFSMAVDDIVWSGGGSVSSSSSSSSSTSSTSSSGSSGSSSSSSSSTSSSGGSVDYDCSPITEDSAECFLNGSEWADLHYKVNGGGLLNVKMATSGTSSTYTVTDLSEGDELSYWFTYLDASTNLAKDTETIVKVFQYSGETGGNSGNSGSSEGTSGETGAEQSGNTVIFTVTNSAWADVHYRINNGVQQNIRMPQNGDTGQYIVENLSAGDVLKYYFTYWDNTLNYAVDTAEATITLQ